MPTCSWCGSEDLFAIGVLGSRAHFRCRACAADCSCPVSDLDEEVREAVTSL